MHNLCITNKNIYIDDIPLLKCLKFMNFVELTNIKVYTVTNVAFCNISGILNIYIMNDKIYKIVFSSFNNIRIYNIQNISTDYNYTLFTFKNELKSKYRIKDENNYYNKSFNFKISYNENNISMLVSYR